MLQEALVIYDHDSAYNITLLGISLFCPVRDGLEYHSYFTNRIILLYLVSVSRKMEIDLWGFGVKGGRRKVTLWYHSHAAVPTPFLSKKQKAENSIMFIYKYFLIDDYNFYMYINLLSFKDQMDFTITYINIKKILILLPIRFFFNSNEFVFYNVSVNL